MLASTFRRPGVRWLVDRPLLVFGVALVVVGVLERV
jgi:hypothetical protein